MEKYNFTEGDGCKAPTLAEVFYLRKALSEAGYKIYVDKDEIYEGDFDHFYLSKEGEWMQCNALCVTHEIPYNDLLKLIKGEPEQSLEQQVAEYKDSKTTPVFGIEDISVSIPFICIEDGRTLLKVDAQGFVFMNYTVVGHEPLLPKYFKESTSAKNAQVEFYPNEPFEVEIDENEWVKRPNAFYIGKNREGNHVIQVPGDGYYSYSDIRNIVEPEFNASMLEDGECMLINDEYRPQLTGRIIMRIYGRNFVALDTGEKIDWNYNGKGRRVNVEHKIVPDENN
jgi:hypothetical protein